jgi:hypothetical protein
MGDIYTGTGKWCGGPEARQNCSVIRWFQDQWSKWNPCVYGIWGAGTQSP